MQNYFEQHSSSFSKSNDPTPEESDEISDARAYFLTVITSLLLRGFSAVEALREEEFEDLVKDMSS